RSSGEVANQGLGRRPSLALEQCVVHSHGFGERDECLANSWIVPFEQRKQLQAEAVPKKPAVEVGLILARLDLQLAAAESGIASRCADKGAEQGRPAISTKRPAIE